MRPRLTVTADSTGIPYAEVPCTSMWDVVEYLSFQRVAVNYQYQASHFVVFFPRVDMENAQRILDAWASAVTEELQTA